MFILQVRPGKVNQRGEQTSPRPHQRRNRQPARPSAAAAVYQAEAVPAAADGSRLRLRAEEQLLPARSVTSFYNTSGTVTTHH